MAMVNSAQAHDAAAAFGTVGTAMVTPFSASGDVDYDTAEALAAHLVDLGNNMLVISGTTGESPTTTDAEKSELLTAARRGAGDRAKLVAGIGTNNTTHSIELAQQARDAGADGLLLVTPYYSKPPQDAIITHMRAVADATDLPVMLYDIPGRSSVPLEPATLAALDAHPNILAVKDAKGDIASALQVISETGLAYYSGEDALNLPLMSCGAIGVVSVAGHVCADRLAQMTDHVGANDLNAARDVAAGLVSLIDAIMNHMPGAISAKAALQLQGVLPTRATRLPLLEASEDQVEFLRREMTRSGYLT